MAYLKTIHRPKCAECSSYATKVLCNRYNAEVNYYCGKHARKALERFQKDED